MNKTRIYYKENELVKPTWLWRMTIIFGFTAFATEVLLIVEKTMNINGFAGTAIFGIGMILATYMADIVAAKIYKRRSRDVLKTKQINLLNKVIERSARHSESVKTAASELKERLIYNNQILYLNETFEKEVQEFDKDPIGRMIPMYHYMIKAINEYDSSYVDSGLKFEVENSIKKIQEMSPEELKQIAKGGIIKGRKNTYFEETRKACMEWIDTQKVGLDEKYQAIIDHLYNALNENKNVAMTNDVCEFITYAINLEQLHNHVDRDNMWICSYMLMNQLKIITLIKNCVEEIQASQEINVVKRMHYNMIH